MVKFMSKSYWQNSFKSSLLEKIQQLPGSIILRQDVNEMGSYRQVTRALKTLVERGELVKLGYGVYSKAFRSPYRNKPVIKDGFDVACKEALSRLGIKFELGKEAQEYNAGDSTQVPVRTVIRLKTRFRGHLSNGERTLQFEDKINAR